MAKKLIGNKYLVEINNAYFNNYYVVVTDMKAENVGAYSWLPGKFHEKLKNEKRGAESLYEYLNSAEKCKKFLAGKIVKIRKESLGKSSGTNKLFDGY